MSGAIRPLPQYAFIAWCSAKAQGQLYLYLLPFSSTRPWNDTNACYVCTCKSVWKGVYCVIKPWNAIVTSGDVSRTSELHPSICAPPSIPLLWRRRQFSINTSFLSSFLPSFSSPRPAFKFGNNALLPNSQHLWLQRAPNISLLPTITCIKLIFLTIISSYIVLVILITEQAGFHNWAQLTSWADLTDCGDFSSKPSTKLQLSVLPMVHHCRVDIKWPIFSKLGKNVAS
jgi:hypothetical protein